MGTAAQAGVRDRDRHLRPQPAPGPGTTFGPTRGPTAMRSVIAWPIRSSSAPPALDHRPATHFRHRARSTRASRHPAGPFGDALDQGLKVGRVRRRDTGAPIRTVDLDRSFAACLAGGKRPMSKMAHSHMSRGRARPVRIAGNTRKQRKDNPLATVWVPRPGAVGGKVTGRSRWGGSHSTPTPDELDPPEHPTC